MKLFSKYLRSVDKSYKKPQKVKIRRYQSVYGILGVILFVFLWTVIGRMILSGPDFKQFDGFLPLPSVKALFSLMATKFFWDSVFSSVLRIVTGIILATIIGIPFGFLIGFYKTFKELTHIPVQFLRMISPLAWMPIAIILLPSFEYAILFLITIATVWPILLNATQGVLNIPPEWIKMAQNQGANDYQLLFKVILPASIPYILTGFRMAIGVAWIVLVPAELLGISSGLGYLINDARDTMEYDRLMAIVIAIGMLGFLLDGLCQLIQKRIDWSGE